VRLVACAEHIGIRYDEYVDAALTKPADDGVRHVFVGVIANVSCSPRMSISRASALSSSTRWLPSVALKARQGVEFHNGQGVTKKRTRFA